MKSITTQIVEEANGLLTLTPEGTFSSFNSGGVEAEVGEFLYGLVRNLKPIAILETGTHWGISSAYMGLALKENGFGKLETLEISKENMDKAAQLWDQLDLMWINKEEEKFRLRCTLANSLDANPYEQYEFIFLDSEPEIRFKELVKFFPNLKAGGFMAIHDLPEDMVQGNINPDHPDFPSWPYGNLPEEMKMLLDTKQLIRFNLPTPRDIAFFYKPTERFNKIK
jgi:predicted O-methyltransferase YrrM